MAAAGNSTATTAVWSSRRAQIHLATRHSGQRGRAARLVNPAQLGRYVAQPARGSGGVVGNTAVGNIADGGAATTATAREAVEEILGEHGQGVVVAAEGLAGGRAQARVVAAPAAAAVGEVPW